MYSHRWRTNVYTNVNVNMCDGTITLNLVDMQCYFICFIHILLGPLNTIYAISLYQIICVMANDLKWENGNVNRGIITAYQRMKKNYPFLFLFVCISRPVSLNTFHLVKLEKFCIFKMNREIVPKWLVSL